MERRQLGRTGISVPVIGIGTWRTFDTDERRAPQVDAALAAGIELFDSSPMYGRAEAALARAIEGRRDRVLVASKIWSDDPARGRAQADYALELFGGRIDVYQVHNLVNVPAQLALIEQLKRDGKVRVIGATHYMESAFPDLIELMRSGRIGMIQIPYSPVRRRAERDVLPLAESLGLGVFVMSPLKGGILDRTPSREELAELGVETWAQAVLKWIASDTRVSTVLTATSHVERVSENAMGGVPPFFDDDQRRLVARIASA